MSNKTHTRKFIASSDLFSDFTVDISLYNIETIDDIIKIFVQELKECLIKNKFTNLVKLLEEKKFHIHGKSIEMILVSKETDTFFICDHS